MRSKSEYNSDLIVDALRTLEIEYVPLNPGATTRGIHDSIVNHGDNKKPSLVLCCHEGIAVGIASGYFRATGKPLAVLIHDIVGLQHATKAIFDAWIDRDAVLLLGGNGPIDIERRRPWIDWIHNALIPNNLIRDYVKWDDQPASILATLEDLVRAYNIATTEPAGPVYISIDAGLQEDIIKEKRARVPVLAHYSPPTLEEGSVRAVERIGRALLDAEYPAILVDKYGRTDEDAQVLVQVVELLGMALLDTGARFNFPSNHPLNLSGLEENTLSKSDVVLALGSRDLFFQLAKKEKGFFSRISTLVVKPDCRIFRIDLDALWRSSWVTEYGRLAPSELHVSANPSAAVRSILRFCRKELQRKKSSYSRILDERKDSLTARSKELRREWQRLATAQTKKDKISYAGLALTARDVLMKRDWVLAFPGYSARGINAWLRRLWPIARYYQYAGRGAGTGTGTAQALGVALANMKIKGRLCIDFQPDGDLLYAASSLFTVSNSKIPLLIIMLNNKSYYNDEEHNRFIAQERGRSLRSSTVGIRIENPNVDYAQLAKSFGVKSTGPITDYSALEKALEEGAAIVAESREAFLVDAQISSE